MKQQETKTDKPLYKVLNGLRTVGNLITDAHEDNYEQVVRVESDGRIIANFETDRHNLTDEEIKANAQYAALAVNTLASVADALHELNQAICGDVFTDDAKTERLMKAMLQAKEALNRIS
jgi:hypothetical protein